MSLLHRFRITSKIMALAIVLIALTLAMAGIGLYALKSLATDSDTAIYAFLNQEQATAA